MSPGGQRRPRSHGFFGAATTTSIRLHTNLFVVAYRDPFIAAKGVASLDVLSGGRLILGIGTRYLEAGFTALGTSFGDRDRRTDGAIGVMRAAWTGASTTHAVLPLADAV